MDALTAAHASLPVRSRADMLRALDGPMDSGNSHRLDQRTRRLLGSLAALLCPPDVVPDLVAGVIDEVELTMQAMPAEVRAALRAGLATYELGALARWGRPASRLAPERAARYLDAWRHGLAVQRELVKAVRSLLCLSYYELPAVKQCMGYQPERWIDKVNRHRLATYGDDIARHAKSLFAPDPLPRLRLDEPEATTAEAPEAASERAPETTPQAVIDEAPR